MNKAELEYYTRILKIKPKDITTHIVPLFKQERTRKKKIKNKNIINVCWWGSYIPLHGVEYIILSVKYIKNENVRIHLFGNTSKNLKYYQNLVKINKLTKKIFLHEDYTFSNGKLCEFLDNHCDYVLGIFGDSEKAKTILPNKISDGIAMQFPIITAETKSLKEFFPNELFYVKNNNPKNIAQTIDKIIVLPKEIIKDKVMQAYTIYQEHFNKSENLKKIFNLIK